LYLIVLLTLKQKQIASKETEISHNHE